ncbi:ALDH-like protein [Schizophyllum commune Tattone D]|nr:ALDH-like protein [Schizophyllum commune Tattone D]
MVDLSPVVSAALYAADNLERWAKVEEAECVPEAEGIKEKLSELLGSGEGVKGAGTEEHSKPQKTTIHKQPKGLVVNISPWNYPIILSLSPLVGAIAAGCTAILKPSEHTPIVAALFAELFPKFLDPDAYAVVNGGVEETGCLLGMKFDHIFFTGSTHVGRIVAAAAAKQLTTVTLELGGKSPVFVDAAHTDLDIAARRILWGRQVCAGQVCVSPDYVLVPRAQQDAFVDAVKRAYGEFWPGGAIDDKGLATDGNGKTTDGNGKTAGRDGKATDRNGETTGRPGSTLSGLHPTARNRVHGLVRDTQGEVIVGGLDANAQGSVTTPAIVTTPTIVTAPTIVRDVGLGDALMKGYVDRAETCPSLLISLIPHSEIFGPILPIVPVDDASPSFANGNDPSPSCANGDASLDDNGDCVSAAIRIINSHPAPLVIYVFTEREGVKERFLHSTRSGTLVLNDCLQQLAVYEMPFGGVGESGSGAWFGKHTFDTFTERRRVRARG